MEYLKAVPVSSGVLLRNSGPESMKWSVTSPSLWADEECLVSRVSGFASKLLTKELPKEWVPVQELSSPSAVFSKERAEEVLCW